LTGTLWTKNEREYAQELSRLVLATLMAEAKETERQAVEALRGQRVDKWDRLVVVHRPGVAPAVASSVEDVTTVPF